MIKALEKRLGGSRVAEEQDSSSSSLGHSALNTSLTPAAGPLLGVPSTGVPSSDVHGQGGYASNFGTTSFSGVGHSTNGFSGMSPSKVGSARRCETEGCGDFQASPSRPRPVPSYDASALGSRLVRALDGVPPADPLRSSAPPLEEKASVPDGYSHLKATDDEAPLPPRPSSASRALFRPSSGSFPRPSSAERSGPKVPACPVIPSAASCPRPHEPKSESAPADDQDGEVMYLGAGLYGRANAPAPKKMQKKERQKIMPGMVKQPPPKPPPRPAPRPPQPGPLQGAGLEIAMPPRTLSMAATERREREQRPASAKRSRSQGALPVPAFGSSAPARATGQSSGSAPASCRSGPPVAPPTNCDEREKQRQEVRAERRRMRAAREAVEAELGRGSLSHAASAPELRGRPPPAPAPQPTVEDMEKQKMRLACKMEILGFYEGYRGALGKMTASQNKKLAKRLTSGSEEAVVDAMHQFNQERQSQLQEWEAKAENQESVHRRLKLINEFCTDNYELPAT